MTSQGDKPEDLDELLAIYKDNFCDCQNRICRSSLQSSFRVYMKEDLNKKAMTITNLNNIITGSSKSTKQISILVFLLNKIHVEDFDP